MIIAALAFVATLAFEIPFAKLEALLIGGISKQGLILISSPKFKILQTISVQTYY